MNPNPSHWSLLLSLACGPALAQVPPGWFITSNFYAGSVPGRGGLLVHHPAGTAASMHVTGLTPDLTGILGTGAQFLGANSIAMVDAAATTFYVGEMVDDTVPASWAVDLHEVVITGTPATGFTARDTILATLNTVPGPIPNSPNRQISGLAIVPGTTDVLVLCAGFTLASGSPLGRYSRSQPGVVTPVPVPGLPAGMPNAIAVSPDGASVWLGTYVDLLNGVLSVLPIQGGAARQVATFPAGVSSLAFDQRTGRLWVGCLGGPPNLFEVDPATGAVTPHPTNLGTINALGYDVATGQFVTGGGGGGIPPSGIGRVPQNGGLLVQAPPPAGWGATAGIVVVPDPWLFCPATAGPSTALAWSLPWTGAMQPTDGLPLAGNGSFGLSLQTTPPRAFVGLLGASFGMLDPGRPLLGGTVCVDLWNPAISSVLPLASASGTWSQALPLPTNVIGTRIAFQAVAIDGPGLAFARALGVMVH